MEIDKEGEDATTFLIEPDPAIRPNNSIGYVGIQDSHDSLFEHSES